MELVKHKFSALNTCYVPKIKGKKYITHDNGAKPFLVIVTPDNKILVFVANYLDGYRIIEYKKQILEIKKYKKVFIGKSKINIYESPKIDKKYWLGNSILVQLTDFHYMFIGNKVYEFKTKEIITKYESYVGNSDVPYPYAVGEKNYYLMIENVYYAKDQIPKDTSAYEHSFGADVPYAFYYYERKAFKKGKLIAHKMRTKIACKNCKRQ